MSGLRGESTDQHLTDSLRACRPRNESTRRRVRRSLIDASFTWRRLALTAEVGEAVEFRADPVGVGVVELVVDGQRKLPGRAGGGEITSGVMGVAEVGEGFGFAVPVAEIPVQLATVLIAVDGLAVVAEVMVCVAEAVPGCSLTSRVADFPVQGERLLAVGEGLPVVAELGV